MNIDENEIKIRDQRQSVRLQSCPDRPQDRDNYPTDHRTETTIRQTTGQRQLSDRPQERDNYKVIFGYGALSGKMLLVRIIENNEIDEYFRLIKG